MTNACHLGLRSLCVCVLPGVLCWARAPPLVYRAALPPSDVPHSTLPHPPAVPYKPSVVHVRQHRTHLGSGHDEAADGGQGRRGLALGALAGGRPREGVDGGERRAVGGGAARGVL